MFARLPWSCLLLLMLGCISLCSSTEVCDEPETDLCEDMMSSKKNTEDSQINSAPAWRAASKWPAFALAMAMQRGGWGNVALLPLLFPLTSMLPVCSATTCSKLAAFYKEENCCGKPEQILTKTPGAAWCPYSFSKPACDKAEPQSPRDLTSGAQGQLTPKAAVLNDAQGQFLPLSNIHFHLGAEHKSEDYQDGSDSEVYDAAHASDRRLGEDVRPGWMCSNADLTTEQLTSYEFQHCKGQVEVGKSYEIHYVHSSAGYTEQEKEDAGIDGIDDGLGGAANGRGLLNPMVVVEGQVFHIVNGGETYSGEDMLKGWTVMNHEDAVMYAGSTTGPSHNNEICSPYSITWHVDKKCHDVSPESFDDMCRAMKELYGLEKDLYPHGSRILVDEKYVVKAEYVKALQ